MVAHSSKDSTDCVPCQTLDSIIMTLQGDLGGISLIDIPDLDEVVTGRGGEDVLCSRVEDDLSNFPAQVSL